MEESKKQFWLTYEKITKKVEREKFLNSNLKIQFLSEELKLKIIDELLQDYKKFKDEVYFY